MRSKRLLEKPHRELQAELTALTFAILPLNHEDRLMFDRGCEAHFTPV